MDVSTATIIAALVAAVVALSKALDFAVARSREKKNGQGVGLTNVETRSTHDRVKSLYEMHNIRDENGVPVWYLDTSTKRALDTIADNTTKTHMLLKSLVESNKRIERAIEKVS